VNIREPIAIALLQLWTNKVRTLLTVLGILIGVGSVVGVVSLGEGLRQAVMGEIDRLGGGRLIAVSSPRSHIRQGGRWVRRPWDDQLTNDDVDRLREESRYIGSVLPIAGAGGRLMYKKVDTSCRLEGTDPVYAEAMGWQIAEGRFLQPADVTDRTRVCVLGQTVAEELFGKDGKRLDELIRINNERFRVVGIMTEKRMFGDDWGRKVLIPFTTLQARIKGNRHLDTLLVHATSIETTPLVVAEVRSILRRYHTHGDKFIVQDIGEELKEAEKIFFILKAVIGGIAGVSLMVGGIGVMNIMLVSVTERTREIGIRKAIGAQPGHIMLQFIIESVSLSVFGGMLGLLLGLALGKGGAAIISHLSGEPFASVISPDAVLLALAFSAAIGIFFGVYPALRAAHMDPVDALRYE
jgi:putative ABC transport system permease protein